MNPIQVKFVSQEGVDQLEIICSPQPIIVGSPLVFYPNPSAPSGSGGGYSFQRASSRIRIEYPTASSSVTAYDVVGMDIYNQVIKETLTIDPTTTPFEGFISSSLFYAELISITPRQTAGSPATVLVDVLWQAVVSPSPVIVSKWIPLDIFMNRGFVSLMVSAPPGAAPSATTFATVGYRYTAFPLAQVTPPTALSAQDQIVINPPFISSSLSPVTATTPFFQEIPITGITGIQCVISTWPNLTIPIIFTIVQQGIR